MCLAYKFEASFYQPSLLLLVLRWPTILMIGSMILAMVVATIAVSSAALSAASSLIKFASVGIIESAISHGSSKVTIAIDF